MQSIVAPALEDDLLSSLVAKAEYEPGVKCSLPPPSVLTATLPFEHHHPHVGGFPLAQMVKNLPAMQEIWIQSLNWEGPPEKGMATHSSMLAWRIPYRGAWWAIVHRVAKSQTQLSDKHLIFLFLHGIAVKCKR